MPTLEDLQRLQPDPVLSQIAIEFRPDGTAYAAGQLMPEISGVPEVGTYNTFGFEGFSVPFALRADTSVFKRVDYKTAQETYAAQEYGLEQLIGDRARRTSGATGLNLEVRGTQNLTWQLLNVREKRIADLLRATTSYAAGHSVTLAGATRWDVAGSTPLADIDTGRDAIEAATGISPNVLALPAKVARDLRRHADVKAAAGVTSDRTTLQFLAEYLEVERIVVMQSRMNTANVGQTASMGPIWGTDAMLLHVTSTPSADLPSFGYQFVNQDLLSFQYREEKQKSDVLRVSEIRAEKVTAPKLGYLFKTVID